MCFLSAIIVEKLCQVLKLAWRQLARFSCCHKKKDGLFYSRNTLVSVEDFTLWKMSPRGDVTPLPKKLWSCENQVRLKAAAPNFLKIPNQMIQHVVCVALINKSPPWRCFGRLKGQYFMVVMDNVCPSGWRKKSHIIWYFQTYWL